MRLTKHITRALSAVVACLLLLTVGGTYATWYFVEGRLPSSKQDTTKIEFRFPIPLDCWTVDKTDEDQLPNGLPSHNLWGAADENGKVESATAARKNLLVDYNPFDIGIQNTTDKTLLISFEITFCLAPSFVEGTSIIADYPFQDPFTISRGNAQIGNGNIYVPRSDNNTQGNVALVKGEKAFTKPNEGWYSPSRDYYYYTGTIDPRTTEGLNVEDFLVSPNEIESFILTVTHSQNNDTACFASIKIIATEYQP